MNYMLHIKMRYSVEPKDRVYVKGYGFLSFAKNMGKNWSNKYSQKLLNTAKKSTTDAIKTASKSAIQKSAEATGDLIGNKITDKITSVSKKTQNNESEADSSSRKDVPKKYIHISRRKTTYYCWIKASII